MTLIHKGNCAVVDTALPFYNCAGAFRYTDSTANPPAGSGYCYNIIDYENDFVQVANLNTRPILKCNQRVSFLSCRCCE